MWVYETKMGIKMTDGLEKYIAEREKRSPGFKKLVDKATKRLIAKRTVFNMLDENKTTPVLNVVSVEGSYKYTDEYLDLGHKIYQSKLFKKEEKNYVRLHKAIFGKQKYCWVGEFKNWIWEFKTGKYLLRVFVNNTQGICPEVSLSCPPKKAMEMFKKYKKQLMDRLK